MSELEKLVAAATRAVIENMGKAPSVALCRANVLRDRSNWRVRLTDIETGARKSYSFDTEAEARDAAPRLVNEYVRAVGVKMETALAAYEQHLGAKGNLPGSVEVTMGRLASVLGQLAGITGELTAAGFEEAWSRFITAISRFTKKTPSVDTQRNTLTEVRSFLKWCVARTWMQIDPSEKVQVIGRRRRGKTQFVGRDESRRFLAKALELAAGGDLGAAAAATVLVMGMRASEVCDRTVRELDDGGKILVITAAKTTAGIRRLRVPEPLVPMLGSLVVGKSADDRIFGDHDRHWLRKATIRVCEAAGVSVLCTHGLRGTHASLAVDAGVAGVAVAASLGHESFEGVTARHYATGGSVDAARADKVAAALGAN